MTRPTRPEAIDTESDAWLWQWRAFEGLGGVVEHEFELEWLCSERRWQVRSSYERAGWCDPLLVADLDEPDNYKHAEQLAHEYAARARGQ